MTLPVKSIDEIEVKSEVSVSDKILILDSESEEARLASKDELKGDKGDKGDTGETGATGPQGPKGDKGDKGDTGAKGDKGDKGDTGAKGDKGDTGAKGDKGDTGAKGDKGDKGDKGATGATGPQGEKGDKGDTGTAATITVGSTTTGDAGTSASVTNSGTTGAAVLDFVIPKGDKGATGDTGATGNGITEATSSKDGKTTTVVLHYTNGDTDSFQVQDGADGQGSGDMNMSTYDPNNKMADAFNYNNFINTPTKVSDFQNDSGFITNAVNDLTNYYLKTETYTKAEVNSLVQNFQGFEVVATLPSSDIKTNVIYLLGPTGSGADKYEEYIYSNSTWVKIGDTSVDLTNYFNKTTNTSDNITQGSTNLFLTSAERTKLGNTSGTNTGDQSASDFDIKDLTDSTGLRTTWSGKQDTIAAGTNIQIASDGKTISATDTTYSASDFDIKDLADTTGKRTSWDGKQDALVNQSNIKSVNGNSLLGSGDLTIQSGQDYSWVTKTISGGEVELGLRTIVNIPDSDFTLTAPATLIEGEEYVIRIISEDGYTMTLGTGFTNPRSVDLSLSKYATDQYVFLAINGELELQPLFTTN